MLRPTQGTVRAQYVNVAIAETLKPKSSFLGERFHALHSEHFLCDTAKNRRRIAGTCADFEDAFPAAETQSVHRHSDDVRLGDCLTFRDREGGVAIGQLSEALGQEVFPGHGSKRLKQTLVVDSATRELELNHLESLGGEVHGALRFQPADIPKTAKYLQVREPAKSPVRCSLRASASTPKDRGKHRLGTRSKLSVGKRTNRRLQMASETVLLVMKEEMQREFGALASAEGIQWLGVASCDEARRLLDGGCWSGLCLKAARHSRLVSQGALSRSAKAAHLFNGNALGLAVRGLLPPVKMVVDRL
jgi:hypothetical protein